MTFYVRALVKVNHSTGLPEDQIINTWAFSIPDGTTRVAGTGDIATALGAFYHAIRANLSSQYLWSAGVIEFIDLAEERPRVAYDDTPLGMTQPASTNNDMPPEVALCLSFKAAPVSGENAARRRGRVYIGPLQLASGDVPASTTTVVDLVSDQANTNILASAMSSSWCIYSRYTHYGVPVGGDIKDYDENPDFLPASFVPVEALWVDNAWDVQRRRGTKATYRKTH